MKNIRILKAVLNASGNEINSIENDAHRLINEGYQLFATHTEHSSNYVYIVMIFEYYGSEKSHTTVENTVNVLTSG